jgi:hypothetical protein
MNESRTVVPHTHAECAATTMTAAPTIPIDDEYNEVSENWSKSRLFLWILTEEEKKNSWPRDLAGSAAAGLAAVDRCCAWHSDSGWPLLAGATSEKVRTAGRGSLCCRLYSRQRRLASVALRRCMNVSKCKPRSRAVFASADARAIVNSQCRAGVADGRGCKFSSRCWRVQCSSSSFTSVKPRGCFIWRLAKRKKRSVCQCSPTPPDDQIIYSIAFILDYVMYFAASSDTLR